MKTFSEFMNEGLVYDTDDAGKQHGGKKFYSSKPINEVDPHPHYERHLHAQAQLDFFHKHGTTHEKIKASKELGIAEKRLKFWGSHPLFDRKKGEEIHAKVKKQWR